VVFEDLAGRLINIVYQDAGKTNSIKGRITSVDDSFLTVTTYSNVYHIRKTAIISIKEFEGGRKR